MYISPEKVKEIRNKLKAKFPSKEGWKFSVTVKDYSTLKVAIMEAPYKFCEELYLQLNHYYLENYQNSDILQEICDTCEIAGFYFHLSVGKYNKPFHFTGERPKEEVKKDTKNGRIKDLNPLVDVVTDNKIILDYMGGKMGDIVVSPTTVSPLIYQTNGNYHKEFNWLMPVIEKIVLEDKMLYNAVSINGKMTVSMYFDKGIVITSCQDTLIEAMYICVVKHLSQKSKLVKKLSKPIIFKEDSVDSMGRGGRFTGKKNNFEFVLDYTSQYGGYYVVASHLKKDIRFNTLWESKTFESIESASDFCDNFNYKEHKCIGNDFKR